MNEYDTIRAAFTHNRKDAELLLHETVREHSGRGNKQTRSNNWKRSACATAPQTPAPPSAKR
ncbi:MAG: hypothetical protein ACLTZH_05280 [Subdoligranulum sp.]